MPESFKFLEEFFFEVNLKSVMNYVPFFLVCSFLIFLWISCFLPHVLSISSVTRLIVGMRGPYEQALSWERRKSLKLG